MFVENILEQEEVAAAAAELSDTNYASQVITVPGVDGVGELTTHLDAIGEKGNLYASYLSKVVRHAVHETGVSLELDSQVLVASA